jgi:hypothetical protein
VEDFSLDRATLDYRPFTAGELVEARLQQRLHCRGRTDLTALTDEGEHLLHKQRVAVRRGDDPLARAWLGAAVRVDQLGAFLRRQWFEQDRGRVQLPAPPGWPLVEQVWPCQTEQQEGGTPGEVGDVVDQAEKRLLSPLDVVEDHNQRPLVRDLLELDADIPKQLIGAECTVNDPREGFLRALAELLEGRDDRPERDPLAVLQAPACEHRCVEPRQELRRQSRLADAGPPKHGEQVAAPLADRTLKRLPELLKLEAAADERRVKVPRDRGRRRIHVQQPVGRTGLRLPFDR